jgi:hypothetical protein
MKEARTISTIFSLAVILGWWGRTREWAELAPTLYAAGSILIWLGSYHGFKWVLINCTKEDEERI